MVKIGHASISENGTIVGRRGDQTGREIRVQNWYSHPWIAVFRPKKKDVAEKIAKAMELVCANDNVGYNQHDRTSLYEFAVKNGFKLDKVGLSNTDCSALVSVCVNYANIKISKDMYTGIEKQVLEATKEFDTLTETKYLTSHRHLKRGDILLAKGHTAIVLSSGDLVTSNNVKKTEARPNGEINASASNEPVLQQAKSFNKSVSGKYRVMAEQGLNMRIGAGTSFDKIAILSNREIVNCYGYYNEVDGAKWLMVKYKNKVGYVSMKYLKRV